MNRGVFNGYSPPIAGVSKVRSATYDVAASRHRELYFSSYFIITYQKLCFNPSLNLGQL
jgi:hypothetical protein